MPKLIGIDHSRAHRVTHQKCGAIIEYFESEVAVKPGRDYSGGSYLQWWIACPQCRDEICVKEI